MWDLIIVYMHGSMLIITCTCSMFYIPQIVKLKGGRKKREKEREGGGERMREEEREW